MTHINRSFEATLKQRLMSKPLFIQCVLGPRQVGKTTGVLHVLKRHFKAKDTYYVACDGELLTSDWLQQEVQKALVAKARIIAIDEIQKIEGWSDVIKKIWDTLKRNNDLRHIVILGSSSLQLTMGLSESLAGRFEVIPAYHWTFAESQKAVKSMRLQEFLTIGGYPAAYSLTRSPTRFRKYLLDSIVETVITRDILRFAHIKKPALFRQTFVLATQYPAQTVSYNKLLGQLQDANNVDQIKHYLDLFSQAYLLRLVFKYSESAKSKKSSPKILPCAPVLTSILRGKKMDSETLGRVFESVVGNRLFENFEDLYYWAHGHHEVDFVVKDDDVLIGVEVKTTKKKSSSLDAFRKKVPHAKTCMIDMENYPLFEHAPKEFIRRYSF